MKIFKSDLDSASQAATIMATGKIAVLPTDTIYGFSGIVPESDSVIRAIKGREETKPFIQLISDPNDIFLYTDTFPKEILDLWPCSLTVIVACKNGETTAFRCPADEWLRSVIALVKAPIYSTSVNRSGTPPLTDINVIQKEFNDEVGIIVEDGNMCGGLPSTLIDISSGEVRVLRQGAIVFAT